MGDCDNNWVNSAIIVAAGRGERAGGLKDGPKQYRLIGNSPIIAQTLDVFMESNVFEHIVVVYHDDDEELLKDAIGQRIKDPRVLVTTGGPTRQCSVANGLSALEPHHPDTVLIHDAVRPFVGQDIISNVLEALTNGEAAVLPAIAVTDTLKRAGSNLIIEQTVSREQLYAAQTPQGFRFDEILSAHKKAELLELVDFTDDCAIAEWCGMDVKIVEGSSKNIKLTTKEDIEMAANQSGGSIPDVRCGNGYDVHQLVQGDHVILCGIKIPHTKSLSGHSDADVALHALTDALLATCGEGDIGDHFPPSDPQWKGAASHIFLEKAVEIVASHGGTITNADVSLIAEQPKIGPHRQAMRQSLSDILGIDLNRCSVKATTNEKIGFIGREEGIAAIATATVCYVS